MKNNAVVIGLIGKQGAGKTSTKNKLLELLPRSCGARFASTIYKMHDAIRKEALAVGIDMPVKDGPLLQYLGTEWGRNNYGEDVWVNALETTCLSLADKHDYIIIDDVRFENEAESIRRMGGVLVMIDVPEEVRKARIPDTWRDPSHPSETGLDGWTDVDMIIDGQTCTTHEISVMVRDAVGKYRG